MSLINLNQINIADATGVVAVEGSIPILSQSDDNLWSSNTTGALFVTSGDISERIGSPVEGHFRHNIQLQEFEVFVDNTMIGADWRPIGQLTQDGSAASPSRSFVRAPDTGSFLTSGGDNYAISVDGVLRIEVDLDDTFICDSLVIDGTITSGPATLTIKTPSPDTGSINWKEDFIPAPKAFIRYNHDTSVFEVGTGINPSFHIDNATNEITFDDGANFDDTVTFNDTTIFNDTTTFKDTLFLGDPGVETVELLPANIEILTVGTNVGLAAPLVYDGTVYNAVVVDYLFKRTGTSGGTNDGMVVGTLHIASDGVTATLVDATTATIGAPADFFGDFFNTSPFVSGGTVTVQYNMGAGSGGGTATLKYTVKRWGI